MPHKAVAYVQVWLVGEPSFIQCVDQKGPILFYCKVIIMSARKKYINRLKTSGDYMHHLLYQLVTLHFVFMGLVFSV
jgi:hypothetical protein